jgi:hypothetical protein
MAREREFHSNTVQSLESSVQSPKAKTLIRRLLIDQTLFIFLNY